MKHIISLLLLAGILSFTNTSQAQFDKFVLQINAGIVTPYNDLKGDDYIVYSDNFRYQRPGDTTWYNLPGQFAFIDSNLIKNNYGASTGFYIGGVARINIDKYEIFRLIGSINYASFNSFRPSRTGSIPVLTYSGAIPYLISYDYTFNNFQLGIGVEIAPTSFTKVFSPFINGTFTFNFFNGQLVRTTSINDSTKFQMNDLRLGLNVSTGVEFKAGDQWGIVLGYKYDFGNLLLKNTDRASFLEWGRTNASINDGTGTYTANIYDPPGSPYRTGIQAREKVINWGTFFIGINFYPNVKKKK